MPAFRAPLRRRMEPAWSDESSPTGASPLVHPQEPSVHESPPYGCGDFVDAKWCSYSVHVDGAWTFVDVWTLGGWRRLEGPPVGRLLASGVLHETVPEQGVGRPGDGGPCEGERFHQLGLGGGNVHVVRPQVLVDAAGRGRLVEKSVHGVLVDAKPPEDDGTVNLVGHEDDRSEGLAVLGLAGREGDDAPLGGRLDGGFDRGRECGGASDDGAVLAGVVDEQDGAAAG